ncbi:MAG: hypothetical protein A2W04_03060 [Betaproteobacteria bacterium RBG_16_64_9]|nr:MAG: hypothetical protein A2W04_03060 [Betaproteobacteria bacterium RBG_16_64_9]OGA22861.1 MAG: hypothetical protein A3I01_20115 [Betaproteobacteria bacterium RIFCSPLOWO2_02_FULL_65_24]OGA37067.1 MAG: hypothetical protein A3G80_14230 [Betaproteobacteria bacterium RIFCSPLOWO2_12_FULL_62_13b]
MPQHLSDRTPRVWGRIDLGKDYEVRYWARKLGVTERELRETVQTVGPIIEKVREHFAQHSRGH